MWKLIWKWFRRFFTVKVTTLRIRDIAWQYPTLRSNYMALTKQFTSGPGQLKAIFMPTPEGDNGAVGPIVGPLVPTVTSGLGTVAIDSAGQMTLTATSSGSIVLNIHCVPGVGPEFDSVFTFNFLPSVVSVSQVDLGNVVFN